MKKTTREFGKCWMCHGAVKDCSLCNGTIQIVIKETIEESDDMEDKSEEKTWSQLAKKWLNYLIISLILVGLGAAYVYLFKEPTTIICKF